MTRLWSSNELAVHEFPTPAYLVEPMIPMGGLAILHGKPGAGKTQTVLTLARAINAGEPFLGRWPTRKGKVVVIQADMTGQIQADRVARVVQSSDISDTYWVVEEDGSIPMINVQTMAIMMRELVDMIREIDPVLIVWDTLRKIHRLNENASETPIIVFEAARKLFPSPTHLFLHHNRKVSRDADAIGAEDEDFMGTQQWKGAVDAVFSLDQISTLLPKRLALTFHKARTANDLERKSVFLEVDLETILLGPLQTPKPIAPEGLALPERHRLTLPSPRLTIAREMPRFK